MLKRLEHLKYPSAVPRYPETRADLERVKKACEDMNQDVEIEKAFENIRKLD